MGSLPTVGAGPSAVSSGAVSWWLSGGISPANCIGAYQAKGAASQAASYVNLANPGTYDCTVGVAPTWASGTGWTFNGSTQYLTTGIIGHTQAWSFVVRFSAHSGTGCLLGSLEATRAFTVRPRGGGGTTIRWLWASDVQDVAPGLTSGVLALCGRDCYRNGGASEKTFGAATFTGTAALEIGRADGLATLYAATVIEGCAYYNTILSQAQQAAVTTALNLL